MRMLSMKKTKKSEKEKKFPRKRKIRTVSNSKKKKMLEKNLKISKAPMLKIRTLRTKTRKPELKNQRMRATMT